MKIDIKVCVWQKLKSQLILLFSLFLLLFISSIVIFGTIHEPHCTISVNFYLYLQYFQQKVFSFSKTNESQKDPKWRFFFFFFGPFESLKGEHITNSNSTQKILI